MDTVRFGRQVRALRRRRGLSQAALAAASGLSRGVVAEIEQGRADRVTVITLERAVRPLRARVTCRLDWDGEDLDRLLDRDHAAIVNAIVGMLAPGGWILATEVSFNIGGERGSIDVLAWHPASAALLVIEAKSTIADLQSMLYVLDRKVRLAHRLATERGWAPGSVSKLLVVRDDRTSRRRVAEHAAIFGNAFPARTREVRRWLRATTLQARPLSGLMFLTTESHTVTRQRPGRTAVARANVTWASLVANCSLQQAFGRSSPPIDRLRFHDQVLGTQLRAGVFWRSDGAGPQEIEEPARAPSRLSKFAIRGASGPNGPCQAKDAEA